MSERPDTLRPEAAIAAEDDFVSEAPLAAAVVAVAARVTPAIRVQRWIASVVPAVALSAVGIVLSLGIVAINWSPELAEAPALANAAAVSHSSDPTALETAVSVTRAGGPVPSPVTPAQNSATVARPVAATSRANVGGPRVGTASDGQLRVTSVPSGARVTVNGIGWGQTPLTIDHLLLE